MKIIHIICHILTFGIFLHISTTNTLAVPVGKFIKTSIDAVEHLKISATSKGTIAVSNEINKKTCRDKNNKINRQCYENKNQKNR